MSAVSLAEKNPDSTISTTTSATSRPNGALSINGLASSRRSHANTNLAERENGCQGMTLEAMLGFDSKSPACQDSTDVRSVDGAPHGGASARNGPRADHGRQRP